MVPYAINMARGHVISVSTRKRWYRWLLTYFILALTAAGISVASLTKDLLDLGRRRARVEQAERRFMGEHPGFTALTDCLRAINQDMVVCTNQLEAIDGFQREARHTARVLLGLAEALPPGVDLGQVDIDGIGGKVSFEVYIPAERKMGEGIAPPHLIALWSASPLLTGKVSRITAEKSERVRVAGRDLMSSRFAGLLGGNK